jgi:DNA repair protein RadA/Sms
MAKARVMFACRECGGVQPRWIGKCPDCGAWDSLQEKRIDAGAAKDPQRGLVEGWSAASPQNSADGATALVESVEPQAAPKAVPIGEVGAGAPPVQRLHTRIGELDRVLGGGFVPGSAVLVGGDPGIGKSTLMLQAAGAMGNAAADNGAPRSRVLYVSSEESADQVALRASRLGVSASGNENLFVLADTNLARIVEQVRVVRPRVLVIDSVQMVYKADLDASPGSMTQLRRCCAELVYLAKVSGIVVVLVGHVTKEGALAGPRLLEHLVDVVLYFEGDRYHAHRIIRGVKNRFGTTLEIGIFEMTGAGLREVPEGLGAAAIGHTVAGKDGRARPGSVVCPVMTGTRCVLVEVQALTATGFLGAAKRKSSGLDANRLAMLIAVLEQHSGLRLADRDVFASSVGGIRVVEPAADLALLLAIAGAHYKKALEPRVAAVGEVGLGGEVRPVSQLEQRINEARRLGFTRVIVPAGLQKRKIGRDDQQVVPVRTVAEALEHLG